MCNNTNPIHRTISNNKNTFSHNEIQLNRIDLNLFFQCLAMVIEHEWSVASGRYPSSWLELHIRFSLIWNSNINIIANKSLTPPLTPAPLNRCRHQLHHSCQTTTSTSSIAIITTPATAVIVITFSRITSSSTPVASWYLETNHFYCLTQIHFFSNFFENSKWNSDGFCFESCECRHQSRQIFDATKMPADFGFCWYSFLPISCVWKTHLFSRWCGWNSPKMWKKKSRHWNW